MGSRRRISRGAERPAPGQTSGPAAAAGRTTEVQTIQVLYSAPIPVGHRVEVDFFKHSPGGPSAAEFTVLVDKPIITDVDTGVVYAALSHYDHAGELRAWLQTPFPERLEPQQDVYFADRLTGTVTACRVITDARTPGKTEVMTQLRVEIDGGVDDESTDDESTPAG